MLLELGDCCCSVFARCHSRDVCSYAILLLWLDLSSGHLLDATRLNPNVLRLATERTENATECCCSRRSTFYDYIECANGEYLFLFLLFRFMCETVRYGVCGGSDSMNGAHVRHSIHKYLFFFFFLTPVLRAKPAAHKLY